MLETRIGVQLYTLRDHCKDVESFDKSCAWIAEQGVREVQVSGVAIEDPAVIRKVLDAHGLSCTVTHRSLDALRDKQASLDYQRKDLMTEAAGQGIHYVTEMKPAKQILSDIVDEALDVFDRFSDDDDE